MPQPSSAVHWTINWGSVRQDGSGGGGANFQTHYMRRRRRRPPHAKSGAKMVSSRDDVYGEEMCLRKLELGQTE